MAKQAYTVLSPVHYDRAYAVDEIIEMEPDEARQLLDGGVICDPDDPRASAAAAEPVDPARAAAYDAAFDALRQAPAGEVRDFLDRIAGDAEIRSKAESAFDRASAVSAAIGGLEEGNEDHWTRDGKPEVRALRAATGLDDITAAERDEAWAAYRANQEDGE